MDNNYTSKIGSVCICYSMHRYSFNCERYVFVNTKAGKFLFYVIFQVSKSCMFFFYKITGITLDFPVSYPKLL